MKTRIQILAVLLLATVSITTVHAQSVNLLKEITPGNDTTTAFIPRDIANGYMYFSMRDQSGNATLWRTDGTTAGTSLYADVQVYSPTIRFLNGLVYFQGYDPTNGYEAWRSDGTPNGTFILKDINRKTANAWCRDFVEFGGDVYFRAFYYPRKNGTQYLWLFNYELWKTDGTSGGTAAVSSYDHHRDLTSSGNKLILDGVDLFASDGSSAGSVVLADVCSTFPADWSLNCYSTPYAGWPKVYEDTRKPVVVNGIYYATLFSQNSGGELWRSDGTPAGTWQLTDINLGTGSSYPSFLVPMGNHIYFAAYSPDHGTELWRYPLNGTAFSQAERVCDIVTGAGSSEPMWLTAMDGMLYFSAWTENLGRELWKSDGVPTGTTQFVADINPGPADSDPQYTSVQYDGGINDDKKYCRTFAEFNGLIYFAATDPVYGCELWSSDGTAGGTSMIADINGGAAGSFPKIVTVLNNKILTCAYTPTSGWEWWVYDTGVNIPPIAVANATPTSGMAPLSVDFSSAGSNDPDGSIASYAWDFGNGGASALADPTHSYTAAGTYTAQLTVTDNDNAIGTASVTITVTPSGGSYVYVESQTVTRVVGGGNKVTGQDVVLIHDANDQPVSGAVVFATYVGPTDGTVSGTTGSNGSVTLVSSWIRNPPSPSLDRWCFTVTDVQSAGNTYNAGANTVTTQCEPIPKRISVTPLSVRLHQNHPNPFNPSTTIDYSLPERIKVSLVVIDPLGREVHRLINGQVYDAGRHTAQFDAGDLPSGIYFYRLTTPETRITRKMLLVR